MPTKTNDQFISLADAAEFCLQSEKSLSSYAELGKLKAVKVDSDWFTTKEWIRDYVAKEYITLQQAARICPYSQEYLSLRARQGKLKAVKIGRNWVCTKEWLQDYIGRTDEYKKLVEVKRLVAEIHEERKIPTTLTEPPSNLPVYAPDADVWEDDIPEGVALQREFQRKLQFGIAVASLVILLCISAAQGGQQALRVAERVNPVVISFVASLQESMYEKGFALGSNVALPTGGFSAGLFETAKGYADWLNSQVRNIAQIFGGESEEQGLVVIPSSTSSVDNEKVKERIKQTFSDEVNVTPYDEESGIITPVFRKRTGEDYFYILVPFHDEQ